MDTIPHIISASRRCDLPAYYGDWFMQCLNSGVAHYRHPYSGTPLEVSLQREDVIGFVFWSKDFSPFKTLLAEIAHRGFPFYCQFTITGLDAPLEPHLPPLDERLACFRALAEHYGPDHMVWRFDPIVISTVCSTDQTFSRFARLCDKLYDTTDECVVSFMQHYRKVDARLKRLEQESSVRVIDTSDDERRALLARMANHAQRHGMRVTVCCQDGLVGGTVGKAHCVDVDRFARFLPGSLPDVPRQGTRRECGCSYSVDIGTYGQCGHECVYCYARR